MVQRKTKTTKLDKGGEYAFVADRLKEFRQDCPFGLIETTPLVIDDRVEFTVRVLKDKRKPESAEATGHAMNKLGPAKVYEKTETQALGRALAILGYLAGGDIASADEMEDFYKYQQEKLDEAVGLLQACETLDELKKTFVGLGGLMAESVVIQTKDSMKLKLAGVKHA